jgi:hypothetical protein
VQTVVFSSFDALDMMEPSSAPREEPAAFSAKPPTPRNEAGASAPALLQSDPAQLHAAWFKFSDDFAAAGLDGAPGDGAARCEDTFEIAAPVAATLPEVGVGARDGARLRMLASNVMISVDLDEWSTPMAQEAHGGDKMSAAQRLADDGADGLAGEKSHEAPESGPAQAREAERTSRPQAVSTSPSSFGCADEEEKERNDDGGDDDDDDNNDDDNEQDPAAVAAAAHARMRRRASGASETGGAQTSPSSEKSDTGSSERPRRSQRKRKAEEMDSDSEVPRSERLRALLEEVGQGEPADRPEIQRRKRRELNILFEELRNMCEEYMGTDERGQPFRNLRSANSKETLLRGVMRKLAHSRDRLRAMQQQLSGVHRRRSTASKPALAPAASQPTPTPLAGSASASADYGSGVSRQVIEQAWHESTIPRVLLNKTCSILEANKAAQAVFGLDERELKGPIFPFLSNDSLPPFFSAISALLAGNASSVAVIRSLKSSQLNGGRVIVFNATLSACARDTAVRTDSIFELVLAPAFGEHLALS